MTRYNDLLQASEDVISKPWMKLDRNRLAGLLGASGEGTMLGGTWLNGEAHNIEDGRQLASISNNMCSFVICCQSIV